MRPIFIIIAAGLLLAVPTFASAGKGGEEALALDLSAIPGGPTLFVKCNGWNAQTRGDWTKCGTIGIWENSNPIQGLQTSIFSYEGKPWDPDSKILA